MKHNSTVLSFWLTIWWDLWWRQPRWHSRYQAFWCLHRCPCGSSTSTPSILPEPAGSPQDQLHQHMLELSKTDAEVWRGEKKVPEKQRCHLLKSWLRCDFTLKNMSRAFQQTASANIKRVKEYVWSENVRLADPQHTKGRLTAHQYQTTLVCRDISKVEFSHLTYIISINTADCCMQQRGLKKLGKCCSQVTLKCHSKTWTVAQRTEMIQGCREEASCDTKAFH